jgi:hypothetical protein
MNMKLYLFDGFIFSSFPKTVGGWRSNKVRAFLSCTNPAETGRTRERVRHVRFVSSESPKKATAKKENMKLLYCIPRYRTSPKCVTVYNAVRQSSRVFVKVFGQNTRAAETTRKRKESHACGGCSLARRRKKMLCRELHSTQMRKPENGGMGKKV